MRALVRIVALIVALFIVASPAWAQADAGPVIRSLEVREIAEDEAVVYVSLETAGPLRSEFRRAGTGEWQAGPDEDSYDYADHIQTLDDLAPGTAYELRVIAYDGALERVSEVVGFTTAGDPPTPPPPFVPRAIYGPGINASSKSDRTIPQNIERGSYRWRATTTSTFECFRLVWRTHSSNTGYSDGDWGEYRFRVYPDDASDRHVPDEDGEPLADMTLRPADLDIDASESSIRTQCWPDGGPLLQEGRRYHLVIDNVHPDREDNYLSFNQLTMDPDLGPPVTMAFDDADLAWLGSAGGSEWANDDRHIPVFDVVYANGRHDGMSYVSVGGPVWRSIGGASRVRERFTVEGGDKRIDGLGAVVQRTAGSDPLTLAIEDADGAVLASVEVPGGSSEGSRLSGSIPPIVLRDGAEYRLVLSAPEGTSFRTHAVLSEDSSDDDGEHRMGSYAFREGVGEYTEGDEWSLMNSDFHANTMTWMEWAD